MLHKKYFPLIAFFIGLMDGLLTKFIIGWISNAPSPFAVSLISICVGLVSFILAGRSLERMLKNKD